MASVSIIPARAFLAVSRRTADVSAANVCTSKADVAPGEAPRNRPKVPVGQLGGAVAPNSVHFTPAKRCNHQVPAGKIASRPARWSARASR